MRIGILAQPESFYFRDLSRAADGHEVIALAWPDLACGIGAKENNVVCGPHRLADFDALLVRSMPPGSLEQVVFRMDLLAILEAQGTFILNPPKSLEAAIDKFLTSAKLQAAGVPTPKTIVCQTWESALEAFEQLGRNAVVKPLFGGEGRGIALLTDIDLAHRAFKMLNQLGAVIYLQEYIEHGGSDLRILFIGDEHYAVRRTNAADFRTNASRGAVTTPAEPTAEQFTLARRAAQLIGAPLAGVDIVTDRAGNNYLLEVNAVPGWKATAQALGVDIARRVMAYIAAN